MKKISLKTIYKTLLVSCLITTFSCKKTFEKLPQDTVDVKNAYQNVYDANAAVIGIYGKLMTLADRYIVLNELRADLVSPTANADIYLKQLDEHTEGTDNPWADPKPWYSLILNINDAMAHFADMYKTGRLNVTDYQQRYSDIGALRCWVYLQLGAQYGDQVRYVTDPLATMDDLKDTSKYPALKLSELLPKLTAFMDDPNRFMDVYAVNNPITGSTNSSLNVSSIDGQSTTLFFINKYALKGDINLWAGIYDQSRYVEAAKAYKKLTDVNDALFSNLVNNNLIYFLERYKVPFQNTDLAGVSTGGLSIGYANPPGVPNPSQTEATLYDSNSLGWRQIFGDPALSTNSLDEIMWQLPFVNNFAPTDPFIDLFSPRGGKYLLKPSQAMMNMWDGTKYSDAVQIDGLPYDARGRLAVKTLDGQLVNMKPLYYYLQGSSLTPTNPLLKQGKWTLLRAGAFMEHYAEAALNDNHLDVAYALLNRGVASTFRGSGSLANVTTGLGFPYDIDARSGGSNGYLGPWYRQTGTRTRARLPDLPTTLYTGGQKLALEDAIIQENARELGFEGYRWSDLVRVAIRRGDANFLASKVRDKLLLQGNSAAAAAAYAKLMAPGTNGNQYGFFMPFKL